jgi:nucleoside-diphosphate-sugar epimerase
MDLTNKKILVTGGRGFVGSNLVNELKNRGLNYYAPTKDEYDLRKEDHVKRLFEDYQPNIVLHVAGKVGGIAANKAKPGDFFYDNIMMNTNVIESARQNGVKKATINVVF